MKYCTTLFLFLCVVFHTGAQTSTSHRKSANAYHNNYQRMASCNSSISSFEIHTDGTLWAWGGNTNGQLGDGTTTQRTSPVQIGTDNKWASIAVGEIHTIGLKTDGTLWAWGNNTNGQLGDGTTVPKNAPVQIGTDNKWVSIAAGYVHTMGLKSDGTLWTWGGNAAGQLGDGSTTNGTSPIQIGTDNNWTSIAAGYAHSLGLKSDGTLWAWGLNDNGQLGAGTTTSTSSPLQIGTDAKWVSIALGYSHTLGLKSDGTLWAWGLNNYGQLGNGATTSSPVQIGTDNKWVSITVGQFHSMGSKSDGTLWAWGHNINGQLGNGSTTDQTTPIAISSVQSGMLSVAAGGNHTVAVKTDGTLWSWGANYAGQLGDGTGVQKTSPVQVGMDNKWITVALGFGHSIGLKSDGTLWAWGYNTYGQLGDGTTTSRNSPVQIGTDNKWVSIAAGENHSLGLKSDGTLWAWGNNFYGDLGDGSSTQRNSPVQIGVDTKWVSITAGDNYSVGLKNDGTLWTWGYNTYGQLGDGTVIDKNSPAQIGIDTKWASVAAGQYHTIALQSDGTLWSWGYNSNGQLGDGTTTDRSSPLQIGTDADWVSVSAGYTYTMALKSNGTLWAWGFNNQGQFGDGTTFFTQALPIQVNSQSNVVALANGGGSRNLHSGIIKVNRSTVCLAGYNGNGQLGNGTTTNSANFTCQNFYAYSWTGATNTDWATATNWNLLQVPTSSVNVTIPIVTNYPIIASGTAASVNRLSINSGGPSVGLPAGGVATIYENIVNNGNGITGIGDLIIAGNSSTLVGSTLSFSGTLTVNNGAVLTTNNLLTLTSNASHTARIAAGSSAGNYISGSITIQQYIPGGSRKYRFLGHPFNSTIGLAGLTDDIDITGTITGSNANVFTATASNAPSSFSFTEANDDGTMGSGSNAGWTAFTSGNSQSLIAAGRGFRVLIRGSKGQAGSLTGGIYTPDPVTLDLTGIPRQGNFVQTLSFTSAAKGWNLISNPYTSNVDWTTVTKTNTNDAIYTYRPTLSGGNYGSYINGSAANGGSQYIEAYSSFFVRANAASPSLGWHETDKTSSNPTNSVFRANNTITNRISLVLKNEGTQDTDEVVMRFGHDQASDGFDPAYDAENLTGAAHDLYVMDNAQIKYSIYHGSELKNWQAENRELALGINNLAAGRYTIHTQTLNAFTKGNKVYLKDAVTNILTEVTHDNSYSFAVSSSTASMPDRFSIVFNAKEKVLPTITELSIILGPNPAKNMVQLSYSQAQALNTSIVITNIEGKQLQHINLGSVQYGSKNIDISKLPAGIYHIQFNNGLEARTEKLIVE